tara:strand:- start:106 stop:315 length:210 start_codon:yes stop_codon:yes gene_type:complete
MYKSGDMFFKKVESNMLCFICRKDNKIKRMGCRIELDEIEHVINTLAYVEQDAVVYKKLMTCLAKYMRI